MSSMNPGTPSGSQSDRNGNGSLGTGGSPSTGQSGMGGPTSGVGSYGAGMSGELPDPLATQGGRGAIRTEAGGRSEFGAFLDDLSELARGNGHGDLRGEIERRVSRARGQMSEALDQGVEMSHRAREQMRRGIDYSRDTVSERPLSALTVAAVGGLIVGLLLSRRH